MSDVTHCQLCGDKLDQNNYYIFSKFLDTELKSKEIVCKRCFLKKEIKDYLKNGVFTVVLLRKVLRGNLIIQSQAGEIAFCKLLATDYKINEKIQELEKKTWFSDSPLREKLSGQFLELGDVVSYKDPVTKNSFLVQKQSKRTAIWLNDSVGSSIEISVSDDKDQSIVLNNINASLENALALIDWVIAIQSKIASDLH